MSSPAGSSSTPSSHNAITVTGNGSGSTTPRNRLSPAPINIIVNNVTTGVQVGEAANARWRQRTLTSSSAASSQRPATFQTRVTSLGSNPCICRKSLFLLAVKEIDLISWSFSLGDLVPRACTVNRVSEVCTFHVPASLELHLLQPRD